jgi:hypothetical protein
LMGLSSMKHPAHLLSEWRFRGHRYYGYRC